MDREIISQDDAKEIHGIGTSHERMANGELRFRLTSQDGNDYIRTEASSIGSWQKAHFHTHLRETYIVENGWMAIAEDENGCMKINVYWPGEVATIKENSVHNVYLPSSSVIHTVKHGASGRGDWTECEKFTEITARVTEREIMSHSFAEQTDSQIDGRFDSYMALYNNLDNLIWRIPGFLSAGAAILIGFAGSVLSKDTLPSFPPVLISGLFFFVGLLFFLSAYSMTRIREHHTMVGEELGRMEPSGYFHRRRHSVSRRWPPAATLVFRVVYAVLSAIFLTLSVVALVNFESLIELVKWQGK